MQLVSLIVAAARAEVHALRTPAALIRYLELSQKLETK